MTVFQMLVLFKALYSIKPVMKMLKTIAVTNKLLSPASIMKDFLLFKDPKHTI